MLVNIADWRNTGDNRFALGECARLVEGHRVDLAHRLERETIFHEHPAASRALGSPDLGGCAVFASGHPCPMCMAAMRLSGIAAVTYAYSNEDGAPYGLSTAAVYADLAKPFAEQSMTIRHVPQGAPDLYADWQRRQQAG